jgi:hypothetical protein
MKRVMVRYTVKPELAAENAALVRAVYEELERDHPDVLRYATFVLDDGVTFVHVAEDAAPDGQSTLQKLPAFQRFGKRSLRGWRMHSVRRWPAPQTSRCRRRGWRRRACRDAATPRVTSFTERRR